MRRPIAARGATARARCRARPRRGSAASRRDAGPAGGRRARRRRSRTRCACASTASGRSARRCLPASAREESGSAFSSSARSISACSSSRVSSSPVRKWRGKRASVRSRAMRVRVPVDLEPVPRTRATAVAARSLLDEFARTLAAGSWDVALLQEVPPWWPAPLAARDGREARSALTSRNALLPLRRASRAAQPGAAQVERRRLQRDPRARRGASPSTRDARLSARPERRVVHGVRARRRRWVANVHACTQPPERAARDSPARAETALRVGRRRAARVRRRPQRRRGPPMPGLTHVGRSPRRPRLGRRPRPADGHAELLDAGPLSDHAPLRVHARPSRASAARSRAASAAPSRRACPRAAARRA